MAKRKFDIEGFKKIHEDGIYFDEKNHKFFDENGYRFMSVSEITGVLDKPWMAPWVAKAMSEYLHINWDLYDKDTLIEKAKKEYRNVSNEAKDIGREIHKWIEDFIAEKKPELPQNENINNGIQAFLKWKKENKVKFIESELVLYHPKLKYCGILDSVAEVNGILSLIDFKSSKNIGRDMHLQTAGYQLAYEEKTNNKIEQRIIIKLGKLDGQFEVNISNDKEDIEAFKAALFIKKWLNKNITI